MKYALSVGAIVLAGAMAINARPIAMSGIHAYQRTLAPLASRLGLRCRFTPSCSHYAEVVIMRDGVTRGGWKTVKRIARCGPWTASGTVDQL